MATKKYEAPSEELVCPLCKTGLIEQIGNVMHPEDPKFGIGLHCPGLYPSVCSAQEVMGHGSNRREALLVIQEKYKLPE